MSTNYVFKEVRFHEFMLSSGNWTKLFAYVCGYMLLVVCLWIRIRMWKYGIKRFIAPVEQCILGFRDCLLLT